MTRWMRPALFLLLLLSLRLPGVAADSAKKLYEKGTDAQARQDYEKAYGVWMHDPGWKQHPEKYARYPYNDFIKDWGPGGEWGIIKSHHIDGVGVPKGYSGSPFATASGVVVVVTVNDRIADKAHIWVEKADKTLGFSPY